MKLLLFIFIVLSISRETGADLYLIPSPNNLVKSLIQVADFLTKIAEKKEAENEEQEKMKMLKAAWMRMFKG